MYSASTKAALLAQARRLLAAGALAEAEAAAHTLLRGLPDDPDGLFVWGLVALRADNAPAACDLLARAAARAPGRVDIAQVAGIACVGATRFGDARRWFGRALALDPDHGPALQAMGLLEQRFFRHREAVAWLRRAADRVPVEAAAVGNYLVALHFDPEVDAQTLAGEHLRLGRALVDGIAARAWPAPGIGEAERRLRVALFSPAFGGDIVGHFLRPFLPGLDRERFEWTFYSAGQRGDEATAEIRQHADRWHDVSALDDAGFDARIAADGIDVLVDLAGHTPGNRLRVFARRPAPVQVVWLDWFDTTGVPAIGWAIGDAFSTPPWIASRFTERVALLPGFRLCYAMPAALPPVAPPPFLRNGHVTFGSFNRVEKLDEPLVATWSRILQRVPGSRLLLKAAALGSPEVAAHVRERFGAHGVDPARLELRRRSDFAAMLAEYADVDIALDTWPYNGGATTCHALAAGVPVVAFAGDRMIARQSAGILVTAGLEELVARDADATVETAAGLAGAPERLATFRAGLRERFAASPVCDGAAFARGFEALLRDLWRSHCAGEAATAA